MDRVGLGRALGFGARQAARTLIKVADAATTPSPEAASGPALVRPPAPVASRPDTTAGSRSATAGHAARAGKSVLRPVAKFTSVLWLETTGLFYAIFAVLLGAAAVRQWRLTFTPSATGDHTRFFIYTAVGAVFAYFAVTNFWKARQRGRR